MNYSLGTAVFFPVLYIYGVGAAMIVTTLAAVVDSVAHKKTVDRMLFNAAQLSLSAVVCGTVYGRLGGTFGSVSLADIWPCSSQAVYIVINVSGGEPQRNGPGQGSPFSPPGFAAHHGQGL